MTRGRGVLGHALFSQRRCCLCSICASHAEDVGAGQSGWPLPWSEVLSLLQLRGACPLGPGELHTHVGFRELFLCLPELIAKKMDRDLPCSKSGAPQSTPFYKSHTLLQPAKGRHCINALICFTGLSLPLYRVT